MPARSSINVKTVGGVSDLPLSRWREYEDIFTDSLWMLGDRDKSGAHDGFYHGNFIPQIPNQFIRRYTEESGVVLDAFLGSGTTMIEARRLGRSCIGVELSPSVAAAAKKASKAQPAKKVAPNGRTAPFWKIITGDSGNQAVKKKVEGELSRNKRKGLDLIVLHPPYHDIIKFSDHKNDLSNLESVEDFVSSFGKVVKNFSPLLLPRHYLAVVIGDKYAGGEWVPLGFNLLQETLAQDNSLTLKSIVVKNMVNNRAKRNRENLWRYRALAGGFYVFRHEYILLFQKKGSR